MPLPLTVSCSRKIQIGFTFLVPAHPGTPGQRAVKRVYVCVCAVIQWIDVTGRDIDDIHQQLHRVAVDVVQSVGDKELRKLWTDAVDNLTCDAAS